MNFITKKHLPRRTFLRGAGVAIALPLLDSMVPAQTLLAGTAASPRSRLACIYVPHGATMDKWTPAKEGAGFEFTEILKPLEKYRDRLVVVSNLAHRQAAGIGSDAGADHARSAAVFLSGAHPEKESVHVGITIDQIVAEKLGQDTPLPSLEVAIEENGLNCGAGYGCAYTNTISWKTPTLPLPMEHNPQVLFEKLFGEGSTPEERLARKQQSHSLLDSVTKEIASLNMELPASDRARMADYLDDVREIERRIQKAEEQTPKDLKVPAAPVGVPEAFDDHFKIMFDLQTLAFRANITRVATMMYARDTSGVRLSTERRPGRFPCGLPSLERSRQHGSLRADQPLPHQPSGLLPGEAARHPGRRRDVAGSFADSVRKQHEQWKPARSRSFACSCRGRGFRQVAGRPSHRAAAAYPNVQSLAGDS